MNINAARLGTGFSLLTLPTLLTASATIDSFESVPLLVALALSAWLSSVGGSDRAAWRRGLWTCIAAGTVLVSAAALIPFTRAALIGILRHENLVAASVGCLALLAYYRWSTHWVRLLFMVCALLACLGLGSRSVAAALVVVLFLDVLRAASRTRAGHGQRAAAAPRLAAMLVVGVGLAVLAVPSWRQQALDSLALLVPTATSARANTNLVPASESLVGWPWSLEGVTVTRSGVDDEGHAVFTVTKDVGAASARPQFRLQLAPNATYTLSIAVRAHAERVPGLTGWAPATGSSPEAVFSAGYRSDGPPVVSTSAASFVQVVFASAHSAADGWVTLVLHLTNLGEQSRSLWLGPTPDVRPDTAGAVASFARFMVQEGSLTTPVYLPTQREPEAQQTARSRLRIFSLALRGIRSAPLIGNGHGSYVRQQLAVSADGFAFAHAHNLALHVTFERGLVGLAGLAFLVAGLLRFPTRSWWSWNLTVLGVLLMNVTDMTLWNAAVALPLGLAFGSVLTSVGPRANAALATGEPGVE